MFLDCSVLFCFLSLHLCCCIPSNQNIRVLDNAGLVNWDHNRGLENFDIISMVDVLTVVVSYLWVKILEKQVPYWKLLGYNDIFFNWTELEVAERYLQWVFFCVITRMFFSSVLENSQPWIKTSSDAASTIHSFYLFNEQKVIAYE